MIDLPPDVKDSLPGVGGSITALLFFRRPWPAMIALFCCGFFAARAMGSEVAQIMNASEAVGGYVTGAFSMAIIEGAIMAIRNFDGAKALNRIFDALVKRLGGG